MPIDPELKRILDKRLATGEIGKEEYRELLNEIEGGEKATQKSLQTDQAPKAKKNTREAKEPKSRVIATEPKKEIRPRRGCLHFVIFGLLSSAAFMAAFADEKPMSQWLLPALIGLAFAIPALNGIHLIFAAAWQYEKDKPPMTAAERKRNQNNMRMFGMYQRGQIINKLDDIEDELSEDE